MANPWDDDEIISKPKLTKKAANPWDDDEVVSTAESKLPAPKMDAQGRFIMRPQVDEGTLKSSAVGQLLGNTDLGSTLIDAAVKIPGMAIPQLAQWNKTRNADREYIADQRKDSMAFQGNRIAGNVISTLPVGGTLAAGVKAAAPTLARVGVSAPAARNIATALRTSGFRAGTATGATAVGLRALTGATTGGISAGLVDPNNALMGAGIGGVLPGGVQLLGGLAGYAGRSVNSLVQPFTNKGQDAIAGKIIREFASDGPTQINAAQLVPGSAPTLAEATGNAGLATLQRGARDIKPNAFVAREEANAAARLASFDDVAGDAGKLDFFRESRRATAKQLYDDALRADTSANFTPYVKGQITQLLKRPSISEARKTAQKWAIERGERPSFDGNMRGLHDMKTAIDDEISVATRAGKGGQVKALEATQAKLLDVMEKLSPAYKEARVTYASMSKPVNAMEALQGLKLTDAKSNITLQKVKSAIEGLERAQNGAGISAAKSVDSNQMKALKAIQSDLLRQSNLGAGRSAGSNTFQNIATDNIVSSFLPGPIGKFATGKVGTLMGQTGQLLYNKPNEAIRNKLAEMMLDPALARNAFQPTNPLLGANGQRFNALLDSLGPKAYRAAPLLSSDR